MAIDPELFERIEEAFQCPCCNDGYLLKDEFVTLLLIIEKAKMFEIIVDHSTKEEKKDFRLLMARLYQEIVDKIKLKKH